MNLRFVACSVLTFLAASLALADEAQDKAEAIKKDRERIVGKWQIVEIVVDIDKVTKEEAKPFTVENRADGSWILFDDGKETSRGESTIDPTKSPKQIDFTATDEEGKVEKYIGIYELGDKTRKLCFGPANQARPAEFKVDEESERVLVVFERIMAK